MDSLNDASRKKSLISEIRRKIKLYDVFERTFHGACWCAGCDQIIDEDYPMELVLNVYGGFNNYWSRSAFHLECVELFVFDKAGFDSSKYNLRLHKRNCAGKLMLLLQELGLPYDLAWSIAAVACWLL
jgi:hypothetical protein